MTDHDWACVAPYFRKDSKTDKWGNPYRIDTALVYGLFELRKLVGKPVHVHCGVEERYYGYHPKGLAVDVHVEGMPLLDQYLMAERIPVFRGIGLYPWWNRPGLHLDRRPISSFEKRWISFGKNKYLPLTASALSRCFDMAPEPGTAA